MTHRPLPLFVFALALALSGIAATASALTVVVTNGRDDGPGSFRHAVERANGTPAITIIQFLGVRTVLLRQTVDFTGAQDLTVIGGGATLDGSNIPSGAAFRVTGGGDLAIWGLTVRQAPGEGVAVEVPPGATGTVHVRLVSVEILGNHGHGMLVNDQEDPSTSEDPDGNPIPPNPNGSAASLDVSVLASRFAGNGFDLASDRDGLRINEGGAGDLTFTFRLSASNDNGADGIELDERGPGDVRVDVSGARLTGNGAFDPTDLDDGFDIDESNDGSILGQVVLTSVNDNFEEGLDFNENNAGDLRVNLLLVEANGNGEEGIDYEEDDDFAGGGDLVTTMAGVRANGNGRDGGDAGLKIREKGAGNLGVAVNVVETIDNLIGGISIREDAVGSLVSSIARATSQGNAGHGIDFDENRLDTTDPGNLTAIVSQSTSSLNTGAGVRADQQSPGTGSLLLSNVALAGNSGGMTTGGGVTVTVTP